jgi:hypothetical protein
MRAAKAKVSQSLLCAKVGGGKKAKVWLDWRELGARKEEVEAEMKSEMNRR